MCKKLIILCLALVVVGLSVPASADYVGLDNPLKVDIVYGPDNQQPKCGWQGWPFAKTWASPQSQQFVNPLANYAWEIPIAELSTYRKNEDPPGAAGASRNRSGGWAGVPGTGEFSPGGKGFGMNYVKLTLTQLEPNKEYTVSVWSYEARQVWSADPANPDSKFVCWSTTNPKDWLDNNGYSGFNGEPNGYGPINGGGTDSNMPAGLADLVYANGGRTFVMAPANDNNGYCGGTNYLVEVTAMTNDEGAITIYGWIDPTDWTGSMHVPLNCFEVPEVFLEPPPLTITASADANGSIAPWGTVAVNYGSDKLFTATANPGYEVGTWYVDGGSVQTGGDTYIFYCVTADHTVFVTFKRAIHIEIHTVKGSGITEEQIRDQQIKKMNEIWKCSFVFVVDSNHPYEPNTPYDSNKNDKGKLNIWGLRTKPLKEGWTNPNSSGNDPVERVIILVPGDGGNIFIKPSTCSHEAGELLGLTHQDAGCDPITGEGCDPNNIMCPDIQNDADGVFRSCHRNDKGANPNAPGDANVPPELQAKARESKLAKAQDAIISGYGDEGYDNVGDVNFGYIDLDWAQAWIEWIQDMYVLHLTAHVYSFSFESYSELGFYIESDNDLSTGQPPEGLDYYVAFQPQSHQIIFERYDTGWMPLDTNGITYEITYVYEDTDLPPTPTGVKFELPEPLLQRRAGNIISYKTVAHNELETDVSPNTGLLSIKFPPLLWPPDFVRDGVIDYKDLDVLTDNWLLAPPIDPNVDLYHERHNDKIDFRDFAVFASMWLTEGMFP